MHGLICETNDLYVLQDEVLLRMSNDTGRKMDRGLRSRLLQLELVVEEEHVNGVASGC
jgi:hypothetical protein